MAGKKKEDEQKIDATVINLEKLLTNTKYKFPKTKVAVSASRFELPEFQRNFVWGKEQISRLIGDIKEETDLYLGNIVTSDAKGGFDFLIDGQQRLVTLSILCLVLKNKASKDSLKEEFNQLLFINKDEPRLSFSKTSLNRFYEKIFDKSGLSVSPLDASEKFLKRAISIVRKETTFLESDEDIEVFLVKIKKLKIVIIKCLDISELSRLFVGLNSTGVELSQTELVKGYLHAKITSKKDKIWSTWIQIEKSFDKANVAWFNQFLRHHWYLVDGYILSSKLSDTINRKKIKAERKVLSEYIQNLKNASSVYISLRSNSLDGLTFPGKTRQNSARDIPFILEAIFSLGFQQVFPVILAFYEYGKRETSYHRNGRSLEDLNKLWRFLLLAKFSKISPSSYEKMFAAFCLNISKTGLQYKSFEKITDDFFKKLGGNPGLSKDKFVKTLNENYRDNEDRITKMMLYNLCDPEGKLSFARLEVEHILPQGKEGKGSFVDWTSIPKFDYDKLRERIYRLGNLSILEKKLNSDAGNLGFAEKVKFYKDSEYDLNKKIVNYDFSSTAKIIQSVEERGKLIAKEIFNSYIKQLTS